MGEMRNAYRIVVEKLEGKRSLGRSRHRLEKMRMYLRETGKLWTGFMWLRIGTSGRLL
jgi:hypothetical protein